MLFDRYEKYQKYINGVPADPPEYKKGDYLGQYDFPSLEDCEATAQYRWVETGDTICVDYSLYMEEKKQVSTDGGVTWKDTDERRGGTLIDKYAEECGWHLVCEWHSIGTICNGYNLVEQFRLDQSFDMGETWEPTDHYKEEIKEYLNKDCALQSEPLTYQLQLEGEEAQSVIFNIEHKVGDNKEYYVIWGDTLDYVDTVTDDGSNPSHRYASPGSYTVKFWILDEVIGDVSIPNGSYGISNWGVATFMNYNAGPAMYESSVYDPYLSSGIPYKVDLPNASFLAEDTRETFRYLLEFYCNSPKLVSIPAGLFTSATKLYKSTFTNSSITSIPDTLYNNTVQRNFTNTFKNCKSLTSVGNALFNGRKTFIDNPKDYYDSNPAPVRCKDCIEKGDIAGAVEACEGVLVTTEEYYPAYPNTRRYDYFSPTATEINTLIEFYKKEAISPIMTFSDTVSWPWISTYTSNYTSDDECSGGEYFYPKVWNDFDPVPNCYGTTIATTTIENTMTGKDPLNQGVWDKAGVDVIYNTDYSARYTEDNCLDLTSTFEGCSSLVSVGNIIADNSKVIRCKDTFKDCINLSSVGDILKSVILGGGYYGFSTITAKDPMLYTIKVDLSGMFQNCPKLTRELELSTTLGEYSEYVRPYCVSGSHNWSLFYKPGLDIDYSNMYNSTSITSLNIKNYPEDTYSYDISGIVKDVSTLISITSDNAHITNASDMAYGCSSLSSVSSLEIDDGENAFRDCISLVDISNIKLYKDASYTFSGCSAIKTVPNGIFPNRQLDLKLIYTFNSCISITTIDNNIIDNKPQLLEDEEDNIELDHTFNNCYSLTNYPVVNNLSIWDFERFYDPEHQSTYLRTYAFSNCYLIDSEVPIEWGGYKGFEGNIIKIEITTTEPNESVAIKDDLYINAEYDISGNNKIILYPGVYNAIITSTDSSFIFPKQTTKITDLSGLYDISGYENCTYICSGTNLWKTRTDLNNIFKNCTVLTDVDDDIFKNSSNVLTMNYPFDNCSLPEDKVTTIMNYVTTLTNADYILRNSSFTSTCGIIDNNPNLISIKYAFDNMPNLTTLPSNFPTSLTKMDGAFRYCTSLTGEAPDLWTRSGLSGIWAFGGCSKLTNYSSIDQKWGGNPHLYCKATGTDECEISISYGELVTDLGINAGVYYWMKNDAIPALKNYGPVPSREVNIYKIGDTNIQNFEYKSKAENVEIYG